MMHRLPCFVLFLAALLPGLSNSQKNPALAGQYLVTEIPGGQHTREYARNGQLIYEVIEREKKSGGSSSVEAIEREWRDDGTPIRDQTFSAGREMKGTAWYMNGQISEKRVDQSIHEAGGLPGTYVERYSDLGVLQSAGVYQGQYRPVGKHRQYDEKGVLRREITYSAKGEKVSEKVFDPSGAAGAEQSYFPDGSRRLTP